MVGTQWLVGSGQWAAAICEDTPLRYCSPLATGQLHPDELPTDLLAQPSSLNFAMRGTLIDGVEKKLSLSH
jgi:hypothetical protein